LLARLTSLKIYEYLIAHLINAPTERGILDLNPEFFGV
jgi:hypothetical protein